MDNRPFERYQGRDAISTAVNLSISYSVVSPVFLPNFILSRLALCSLPSNPSRSTHHLQHRACSGSGLITINYSLAFIGSETPVFGRLRLMPSAPASLHFRGLSIFYHDIYSCLRVQPTCRYRPCLQLSSFRVAFVLRLFLPMIYQKKFHSLSCVPTF